MGKEPFPLTLIGLAIAGIILVGIVLFTRVAPAQAETFVDKHAIVCEAAKRWNEENQEGIDNIASPETSRAVDLVAGVHDVMIFSANYKPLGNQGVKDSDVSEECTRWSQER